MTPHFKLWIGIIVIVNFIITYLLEKVVMWYISVWWKRRTDRKIKERRERDIAEDEAALQMGAKGKNKNSALGGTNIGGDNVYLPPIDENAGQESEEEKDRE